MKHLLPKSDLVKANIKKSEVAPINQQNVRLMTYKEVPKKVISSFDDTYKYRKQVTRVSQEVKSL